MLELNWCEDHVHVLVEAPPYKNITDNGLYELKGRAFNLTEAKNKALTPYSKQIIYNGLKEVGNHVKQKATN